MSDTFQPVEVRILAVPVDAYREASEHGDELLREFALIRERESEGGRDVPRRLLALAERLSGEFAAFTTIQDEQLRDAVERDDESIDLLYRVPPAVKEACIELDRLLHEADEFCRAGEELLTLATPPRSVAFRAWFLDQFVRQVDGKEPTPWEEPAPGA